jgi:hypothetical protein
VNDKLIAAREKYSELVDKSNDTLSELESLVNLIQISAKNDITIRIKEKSISVFSGGNIRSSSESLSEQSNLSDLSSESSEVSSTNSLPQQVGTTTLSPQQEENATSPIVQADNATSPIVQADNVASPIEQAEIAIVLPINTELADHPEFTRHYSSASDDDVLSVITSSDVSGPLAGEGFASLFNHRAPDMVTYSGKFRDDLFTYSNYVIDLSGPDTIYYRYTHDYIVDAINNIDKLTWLYSDAIRLECMLFENFNADLAATKIYFGATTVIEILSCIN